MRRCSFSAAVLTKRICPFAPHTRTCQIKWYLRLFNGEPSGSPPDTSLPHTLRSRPVVLFYFFFFMQFRWQKKHHITREIERPFHVNTKEDKRMCLSRPEEHLHRRQHSTEKRKEKRTMCRRHDTRRRYAF